MYLAGVSTRQVDDISQLLWGDRMPSQTLSDKLKKVYADIDAWRGRPLTQEYPYVFMDGVWHKRCWGGSVENVSVLVAVGVGVDGRREVLAVAEGMKEDAESWREFITSMTAHGLKGARPATGTRASWPRWAADALKAVFAVESRDKALEKAESAAAEMDVRKPRESTGETTTYLLGD